MAIIWLSYGHHMAIIWLSYGYHMALKWGPPKVCPEEKVAVWFMMIYDDLGWDFGMPCFQTNPATRNRPTLVLLHWRRCVKTMHRSVSAALCRAPYSSRCRDHGEIGDSEGMSLSNNEGIPMDTPYRWNPWWIGPWMWPLIPSWHKCCQNRLEKQQITEFGFRNPNPKAAQIRRSGCECYVRRCHSPKRKHPQNSTQHTLRHGNNKIWSAVAQSMHRLGLHVSILSAVFVCLSIHKLAQTSSVVSDFQFGDCILLRSARFL